MGNIRVEWNKDAQIMSEISGMSEQEQDSHLEAMHKAWNKSQELKSKSTISDRVLARALLEVRSMPVYWPQWKKELRKLYEEGKYHTHSRYKYGDKEYMTLLEQSKIVGLLLLDEESCVPVYECITDKTAQLLSSALVNPNAINDEYLLEHIKGIVSNCNVSIIQRQLDKWFDEEYPETCRQNDPNWE